MNGECSDSADLSRLIAEASNGDLGSLDILLARYRPYLRVKVERYLRPLFRSRFDGSDIVQQTCYEAFRGIESLRGATEAEFNAWINRILKNNVANRIRDHTADKRDIRREHAVNIADSEISIQWCLATPTGQPESRVIKGEAALLLAESLARLDPDQQTAIQMRYFEMYTLAEIAAYMQISTATAVRLIDRGLQALHHALPKGVI